MNKREQIAKGVKLMDEMANKTDLTEYSDGELSLHVFNDEYLYKQRRSLRLRDILEEMFIFTEEQWNELKDDLYEDEKEEE